MIYGIIIMFMILIAFLMLVIYWRLGKINDGIKAVAMIRTVAKNDFIVYCNNKRCDK